MIDIECRPRTSRNWKLHFASEINFLASQVDSKYGKAHLRTLLGKWVWNNEKMNAGSAKLMVRTLKHSTYLKLILIKESSLWM